MGSLSVWHWLVLLVAVAIPLALVAEAARRVRAEGGVMTPGFKGWLFLLAAAVWITPLRGLAEIVRISADGSGVTEHFPWLVRIDLALSGLSVLLSGLCLVLMLRRAAAFRTVFPLVAGWIVLSFPLSVLAARTVLASVYGVEVGMGDILAAIRNDIPQWAGGLAATIGWVVYLRRSRRVAMTFVA